MPAVLLFAFAGLHAIFSDAFRFYYPLSWPTYGLLLWPSGLFLSCVLEPILFGSTTFIPEWWRPYPSVFSCGGVVIAVLYIDTTILHAEELVVPRFNRVTKPKHSMHWLWVFIDGPGTFC